MRRPLDLAALAVESFDTRPAAPAASAAAATDPDCPTATGCTCHEWCLSIVRTCGPTITQGPLTAAE